MHKAQIEGIISTLEGIQSQIWPFIGSSDPEDVWRFISGFRAGLAALGVVVDNNSFNQQTAQSRGWQWSAGGVRPQMKEQGFSNKEISNEILLIEIESWKQILTTCGN